MTMVHRTIGRQPANDVARSSRRGWQQIGWEAARRRCCRPIWSSTSSRACPRPRRTLDGQQLDDGLAGGPDSSSGPPVKLVARGGRVVVGWGSCGSTVTQTQVLRAGVPWSSRAGLRGQHEDPDGRATQIHLSSAGAPIFTPFASGIVKVPRLRLAALQVFGPLILRGHKKLP